MKIGNKFIFAHILKCAGHYVDEVLSVIDPDSVPTRPRHAPIAVMETKDKVLFTTIRNPFEFYVSIWSQLRRANGKYENLKFGDFIQEDMLNDFKKFLFYAMNKQRGIVHHWMDFDIMNKCDIGWYTFSYIYICCNYIKAFEDINDFKNKPEKYALVNNFMSVDNLPYNLIDFAESKLGIKTTQDQIRQIERIPYLNSTVHNNYDSYYNTECKELVLKKDWLMYKIWKNLS